MESEHLISKKDYYQMCINYALDLGWVKPDEKEILVKQYLKPIFQAYVGFIKEVEPFLEEDPEVDINLDDLVIKLNPILNRTQRIGSTDSSNILRSIKEYIDFACLGEYYTEYAATNLFRRVAEVISNN